LVHHLPSLRPEEGILRPDLEAAGHREDEVIQPPALKSRHQFFLREFMLAVAMSFCRCGLWAGMNPV